ncbi:unnamed protein product [Urochloa humidicola]
MFLWFSLVLCRHNTRQQIMVDTHTGNNVIRTEKYERHYFTTLPATLVPTADNELFEDSDAVREAFEEEVRYSDREPKHGD